MHSVVPRDTPGMCSKAPPVANPQRLSSLMQNDIVFAYNLCTSSGKQYIISRLYMNLTITWMLLEHCSVYFREWWQEKTFAQVQYRWNLFFCVQFSATVGPTHTDLHGGRHLCTSCVTCACFQRVETRVANFYSVVFAGFKIYDFVYKIQNEELRHRKTIIMHQLPVALVTSVSHLGSIYSQHITEADALTHCIMWAWPRAAWRH